MGFLRKGLELEKIETEGDSWSRVSPNRVLKMLESALLVTVGCGCLCFSESV